MKTKTKIIKRLMIFLPAILILNCNCEKEFIGNWPVNPPERINDGLDVGTIEEVNIDPDMISEALGRISQGKYGEVHSMLVYKDNKLVLEEYFEGHRYQWDAPKHHGEWVEWTGPLYMV